MTGSKVDMMLDSGVVLGVSMVAEVEEKSKVAPALACVGLAALACDGGVASVGLASRTSRLLSNIHRYFEAITTLAHFIRSDANYIFPLTMF